MHNNINCIFNFCYFVILLFSYFVILLFCYVIFFPSRERSTITVLDMPSDRFPPPTPALESMPSDSQINFNLLFFVLFLVII